MESNCKSHKDPLIEVTFIYETKLCNRDADQH